MADQPETPTMETLDPQTPSPSSSSSTISYSKPTNPSVQNQNPSPMPPSLTRLWRPAAQRNLRNQWSKLVSCRKQWVSSSSSGKSHATSLVNAHLSQRYMPSMELGVLSDMLNIRKKAGQKLFKQQETFQSKLLSSYKDMVAAVTQMVNASKSMRTFLKGPSNSALVQFSSFSGDQNDSGDGGGIPVFAFWSISSHEQLAEELVQMFIMELNLKVVVFFFDHREILFNLNIFSYISSLSITSIVWSGQRLLVLELLSTSCNDPQVNGLHWSDQLYPGEFDHLSMCNLFSQETCEPVPPKLMDLKSDASTVRSNNQPNPEVLQVLDSTVCITK
ncbi:uncharacterized protein LOC115960659 isoform X1 [Quercus lobata]|uniref:uncharacterized protein LOC115960659 isoform X1 n=1 Tax=Quercus lobata TaxID=97700 RepID=UPI0012490985|nr:uncharacterized protein LOC115960659 isoform X1 [Quercus lobata]